MRHLQTLCCGFFISFCLLSATGNTQENFNPEPTPVSFDNAKGTEEKCNCLLKWSSRVLKEFPGVERSAVTGQIYQKTINLYADEYFVPVFGTRFDELGKGERNRIAKAINKCIEDKDFSEKFQWHRYVTDGTFSRDFGEPSFQSMTGMVKNNRIIRSSYSGMLNEINTLQEPGSGFSRMKEIERSQPSKFAELWPSELNALKVAINTRRSSLAKKQIETELAQVDTTGPPYDVALALNSFEPWRREYFAWLDHSVADEVRTKIRNVKNSCLAKLIQEEQEAIAEFKPGEEGIIEANEWSTGLLQKYTLFNEPAMFTGISQVYFAKRKEMILSVRSSIASQIEAAGEAELSGIEVKYLGPPLNGDPVVEELRKKIIAKKDAFENERTMAKEALAQQKQKEKQEETDRKLKEALALQNKVSAKLKTPPAAALDFTGITDREIYDGLLDAYARDFLSLERSGRLPYILFIALLIESGEICQSSSTEKINYWNTTSVHLGAKSDWDYYISRSVYIESKYVDAYFDACTKRRWGGDTQAVGFEFEGASRMENFVFWGLRPYLGSANFLLRKNGCGHPGIKLLIENLYDFIAGKRD